MHEQDLPPSAELLTEASEGSEAALTELYRWFLLGPIYVPCRNQLHPLSDAPHYPDDLFDLLGLQANDRSVVPIFTDPGMINAWCGTELTYRNLTGVSLLAQLPEAWWVVLNPGSEVEKEFSPWELEKLREGPSSIPEIVAEASMGVPLPTDLTIRSLEPNEHQPLIAALKKLLPLKTEVLNAHIALGEQTDQDGSCMQVILVGLELETLNTSNQSALKNQLTSELQLLQIGDRPIKIILGTRGDTLIGLFKSSKPFYTRQASFRHWIQSKVRKS